MARKPSLIIASFLLGVLLLSGVEARKLHQSSLTITNLNGNQRGTITSDEDGSIAQARSTGTNVAVASATVSSTPVGQTARVGTFGDSPDGSTQGLGLETGPRTPRSRGTGSGTSGSGTAVVGGGGSATAGSSGRTSVTITGQAEIRTPADDEEMNETETTGAPAPVPSPLLEDEDEVDEAESDEEPEEVPQMSVSEPNPISAPVPEPKALVSDVVEGEEDEDKKEGMRRSSIAVSTSDDVQKINVAGKSGRRVCLTSDVSNLDMLLDEGYEVTILTPIRAGYDIITIYHSDYAIVETSMVLDYVPEDVQELCNYDPETVQVPARRSEARQDPAEALAAMCLSRSVLYTPGLLDLCWRAGLLTYTDVLFSG